MLISKFEDLVYSVLRSKTTKPTFLIVKQHIVFSEERMASWRGHSPDCLPHSSSTSAVQALAASALDDFVSSRISEKGTGWKEARHVQATGLMKRLRPMYGPIRGHSSRLEYRKFGMKSFDLLQPTRSTAYVFKRPSCWILPGSWCRYHQTCCLAFVLDIEWFPIPQTFEIAP